MSHKNVLHLIVLLTGAAGPTLAQSVPAGAHADGMLPAQERLLSSLQVTCAGERVSVTAENATLGAVLEAVAECTNARIDVPATQASIPVAVRLGPAAPQDVIADLLDGLNYMMVNSEQRTGEMCIVAVRAHDANPQMPGLQVQSS